MLYIWTHKKTCKSTCLYFHELEEIDQFLVIFQFLIKFVCDLLTLLQGIEPEYTIFQNGSLRIDNVTQTHQGTYRCEVTNGFGKIEQIARLLVARKFFFNRIQVIFEILLNSVIFQILLNWYVSNMTSISPVEFNILEFQHWKYEECLMTEQLATFVVWMLSISEPFSVEMK